MLFVARAELFYATTNFSSSGQSIPLIFEQIIVQRGQGYNLSSGYFKSSKNGTYLSHVTSSLFAHSPSVIAIKIKQQSATSLSQTLGQIDHTSSFHDGIDLSSAAFMFKLNKNDTISLYLNLGSARMRSSWSAFLLDDLMFPLIKFVAQIPDGVYTEIGKIAFGSASVNFGGAWNSLTSIFTAPRGGTYIFNFNVQTQIENSYVGIYVNNVNDIHQKVYLLCGCSCTVNGYDTTSKTFVLLLNANHTVYAYSYNQLYNNGMLATSFAGFLYEPLDGRKVIWSVSLNSDLIGQYSPLPFQAVLVHVGEGWKNMTSKVIVPYGGVYQLHLTATSLPYNPVEYT